MASEMEFPGKNFRTSKSAPRLLIRPDLASIRCRESLTVCLRLAECWLTTDVLFLTTDNAPRLARKRIVERGFQIETYQKELSAEQEFLQLKNSIDRQPQAAVVLDGSDLKPAQVKLLQISNRQVVWLNDSEYALRPEFYIGVPERSPESKKIVTHARRLAVLIHESSSNSLPIQILESLDQIHSQNFSIELCVESKEVPHELLRDQASASRHSIRIHRHRSNLDSLLARIDLAIIHFGSGYWQFAYHGIPTIAVGSSKEACDIRYRLEKSGAIETVEMNEDQSVLQSAIRRMLRNRERRKQLSDAAKKLVDGQGAARIVDQLAPLTTNLKRAS